MFSQITAHMCIALAYFLGNRFIDCGLCGRLGTVTSYNKAKPKHHHYNDASLFLVYEFWMNLLIVGFDIKVAGHSK